MKRSAPLRLVVVLLACLAPTTAPTPAAWAAIDWSRQAPIPLRVDATDLPRRLLRTEMVFPAEEGPMDFFFVLWTPGNHNPSGPIQNMVDLFFEDGQGRPLRWRRDPRQIVRFTVDVPRGVRTVRARFRYIASQPSVNSRSTDSYGEPTLGAINWNTVLLYPSSANKLEIRYAPSLQAPPRWRLATALTVESRQGDTTRFAPVSLAELVDSPVILGEILRTYQLPAQGLSAPHYLHVVAHREEQATVEPSVLEPLGRMLVEAERVFGPFPRDEYHFLVVASDDTPGFGVEHDRSTFIGLSGDAFVRANKDGPHSLGVFPHEYIHAWCGKLRAPRGLHGPEYYSAKDASMLWVYEGLTSYYDEILAARSGMQSLERFVVNMTNSIVRYQQQAGRRWRSVEDTARAQRVLRAPSPAWADLRRRQDYYGEGALFWAFADARIRTATRGARSLDDFCLRFFRVEPGPRGSHVEYTRQDVVDALTAVAPSEDWSALIEALIESPASALPFELPSQLGYRLEHASEPTKEQRQAESRGGGLNLRTSLGLSVDREGRVVSIAPESPADRAKLAYGMQLLAVGDEVYTPTALRDAVAQTPKTGGVSLLVTFGPRVQRIDIAWSDGLRYPRLAPVADEPLLPLIAKPRR